MPLNTSICISLLAPWSRLLEEILWLTKWENCPSYGPILESWALKEITVVQCSQDLLERETILLPSGGREFVGVCTRVCMWLPILPRGTTPGNVPVPPLSLPYFLPPWASLTARICSAPTSPPHLHLTGNPLNRMPFWVPDSLTLEGWERKEAVDLILRNGEFWETGRSH